MSIDLKGPSGDADGRGRPLTPSGPASGSDRGDCRGEWPNHPGSSARIRQGLGTILDHSPDERPRIMAARALIALGGLDLKQQTLDLQRAKFEHLKATAGVARDQDQDHTCDPEVAAAALRAAREASERGPRDPEHPPDD